MDFASTGMLSSPFRQSRRSMTMTRAILCAAFPLFLLSACGADTSPPPATGETTTTQTAAAASEANADQAQRIANQSIIVDTHIDVPYRLQNQPDDISQATDGGDFDYPRAVAGGLNAAFMSIYTPAELEAEGKSKEVADELIDLVERIVAKSPDKFAIARSPDDVRQHFQQGLISLPLGMENGAPIEGELANIKYFFDRGIRYITLTHGLSNHISDSSYDDNKRWQGLSPFGEEVVREMNRLGIIVDISHVSDDAYYDVLDVTAVPVVATHSSARYFTPGFERNMSDDMIRKLADNGGLIMINYGSTFLTAAANEYASLRSTAREEYDTAHGDVDSDTADANFSRIFETENGPFPFATLDDVLDHIDHVVELVGVDHVGIGSDYDGVGDSLPTGLKDVSSYPNLVRGLLERGYSEADIRKILGENLLRVWASVESHALGNS